MLQLHLYIQYLSTARELVNNVFNEYFSRLFRVMISSISPDKNENNQIYAVHQDDSESGKNRSLNSAGNQHEDISDDYFEKKLDLTDSDIFNRIWKAEKQSLYWIALRILEDRQEAQDVVTEAFVQLHQQAIKALEKEKTNRGFTNDLAVRGWLRVTVRNKALTLAEQHRYHRNKLGELSALFHNIETQQYQEDLLASVLAELHRQIEALPPKRREIFKLRYLDRLSNEAIAEKFGIEHQSVRNHLVKALKALRLSMGKHSHLLSILLVLIRRHD